MEMNEEKSGRNDFANFQKRFINLRDCFTMYVSSKYKRMYQQELDVVCGSQFELECSALFEKLEKLPEDCWEKELTHLENILMKHNKLLQILCEKQDCPISQIIDAI